jgi:pteridine reductase
MDFPVGEKLQGVTLITGGARRVGAAIARALHGAGMQVAIHYHASAAPARALAAELNRARPDSACALRADLASVKQIERLASQVHARWGRLDALINNASSYYTTPLGSITDTQFDDLIATNFKAPLFLTQACAPLFGREGAVVNIIDTLAQRAMPGFAPYAGAKAALWSLTESLAVELAPRVRVNAVARVGDAIGTREETSAAARTAAPAGPSRRYRRCRALSAVSGGALCHRRDPAGGRRDAARITCSPLRLRAEA